MGDSRREEEDGRDGRTEERRGFCSNARVLKIVRAPFRTQGCEAICGEVVLGGALNFGVFEVELVKFEGWFREGKLKLGLCLSLRCI